MAGRKEEGESFEVNNKGPPSSLFPPPPSPPLSFMLNREGVDPWGPMEGGEEEGGGAFHGRGGGTSGRRGCGTKIYLYLN